MSLTPQLWNSSANLKSRNLDRRAEDLLNALEVAIASGLPGSPYNEHPPLGPATYFRALKRHTLVLLFVGVLCASGAWIISQGQPKVYQARTTLELLDSNRSVMNMKNFISGGNSAFGEQMYMETQVSLLRSASLLKRVRTRLEREGV